jgi:hypothetical protein
MKNACRRPQSSKRYETTRSFQFLGANARMSGRSSPPKVHNARRNVQQLLRHPNATSTSTASPTRVQQFEIRRVKKGTERPRHPVARGEAHPSSQTPERGQRVKSPAPQEHDYRSRDEDQRIGRTHRGQHEPSRRDVTSATGRPTARRSRARLTPSPLPSMRVKNPCASGPCLVS